MKIHQLTDGDRVSATLKWAETEACGGLPVEVNVSSLREGDLIITIIHESKIVADFLCNDANLFYTDMCKLTEKKVSRTIFPITCAHKGSLCIHQHLTGQAQCYQNDAFILLDVGHEAPDDNPLDALFTLIFAREQLKQLVWTLNRGLMS